MTSASPTRTTASRPTAGATLYFQADQPAPPGARRLLLVSYHFPPDPAVGGLRWQQMIRHLGSAGWVVDVITRDFSAMPGLDPARLRTLPAGTRIFTVADREPMPGRIQRYVWPMVRRLRGERQTRGVADALSQAEIMEQRGTRQVVRTYLAWLEFARGELWARAAADVAIELAGDEDYDVIVSSGPPHMAHLAGTLTTRATGISHVVDMRDPWSLNQRLTEDVASPLWLRLARKFERRVLDGAALVTMNTEAAAAAMRNAYPALAERFKVVRNGCDDEPLPTPAADRPFSIRFAGSIYMDRDPRLVFRAAARVIREQGLTPAQFRIDFVGDAGSYGGTSTIEIAAEEGVRDHVTVGGMIPRREVMSFLANAAILLSLPQDSDFAIPAKIYEYMRFEAWMLVLAHPGTPTAVLLEGTDADVVEPSDVDRITSVLREHYLQFAAGVRPRPVGRNGQFDRRVQAEKLVELVQSLEKATASDE